MIELSKFIIMHYTCHEICKIILFSKICICMVYSTVPVDDSQIGDKMYNLLNNKVTEFFALFLLSKSFMHLVVRFRCLSGAYKCPLVNKIIARLYSVAQQLGENLSSKPVSDPVVWSVKLTVIFVVIIHVH